MGFIEEMKWWHWIVVSLLIGAALGFVNSQGTDAPPVNTSMDSMNFERQLLSDPINDVKDPKVQIPWVSHIMVYPPKIAREGNGVSQAQVVIFTGIEIVPTHPERTGPKTFTLIAPYPYVPKPRSAASPNAKYPGTTTYIAKKGDTIESIAAKAYGSETAEGRHAFIDANYSLREAHSAADRVIHPGQAYFIPWNPAEKHTIVDFLKAAAVTQARPIPYRYAWWQESNYVYEIWMAGSFVLVGLIWPALIRIMIGGGMGRMKGEDYDLTRFKGGRDFIRQKEAKKEMSTEDLLKLTELEESLKASLKAGAEAAPVAQAASAPAAPQVVKLKGALATDTAPIAQTEEEKHYKGVFYPVELPDAKPTDDDAPDKKIVKPTPNPKKPGTPDSKKT